MGKEKKPASKRGAKTAGKKFRLNKGERQPRNLKEALKGKLTKKEMKKLITSFDSVGNIAVIQVPKGLEKKANVIGKALLSMNRHFETVCMVSGEHKGKYRVQPVKVIAGKKSKIAAYKESGCRFEVHLGRVFFSPRLSTERQRIAGLIKENEAIGAFFAGVGPFPIVLAKLSGMKKAYAIELNPEAHREMLHNILLNKCREKIEPILGDVKKIVPERLVGKCDRVVMPMPKGGENFLNEAMIALKPEGGIVHFYRFVEKENGREQATAEVERAAEALGMQAKILRLEKVRSFSASKEQIVIDFWAKKRQGGWRKN